LFFFSPLHGRGLNGVVAAAVAVDYESWHQAQWQERNFVTIRDHEMSALPCALSTSEIIMLRVIF
jgi:hypothetical protein